MAKVKIEYDFENGNSGTNQAIVSEGILDNILQAAMTNKRYIIRSHWSRMLKYYKGRYGYNPYFNNAIKYKRLSRIRV